MAVQTAELRTAVMKIGEAINKGSSGGDDTPDGSPPGGDDGSTYDAEVKDAPNDKK